MTTLLNNNNLFLKQQHRWRLYFGNQRNEGAILPPHYIKSVERPTYNIGHLPIKMLYNHTYNFPKRLSWKPINIVFYDISKDSSRNTAAGVVEAVSSLLTTPVDPNDANKSTQLTLTSFLKKFGYLPVNDDDKHKNYHFNKNITKTLTGDPDGKLVIEQLDAEGTVLDRWELYNPLMVNFKPSKMDYSDDGISTISVTINYDWANLNRSDAYGTRIPREEKKQEKDASQQTLEEKLEALVLAEQAINKQKEKEQEELKAKQKMLSDVKYKLDLYGDGGLQALFGSIIGGATWYDVDQYRQVSNSLQYQIAGNKAAIQSYEGSLQGIKTEIEEAEEELFDKYTDEENIKVRYVLGGRDTPQVVTTPGVIQTRTKDDHKIFQYEITSALSEHFVTLKRGDVTVTVPIDYNEDVKRIVEKIRSQPEKDKQADKKTTPTPAPITAPIPERILVIPKQTQEQKAVTDAIANQILRGQEEREQQARERNERIQQMVFQEQQAVDTKIRTLYGDKSNSQEAKSEKDNALTRIESYKQRLLSSEGDLATVTGALYTIHGPQDDRPTVYSRGAQPTATASPPTAARVDMDFIKELYEGNATIKPLDHKTGFSFIVENNESGQRYKKGSKEYDLAERYYVTQQALEANSDVVSKVQTIDRGGVSNFAISYKINGEEGSYFIDSNSPLYEQIKQSFSVSTPASPPPAQPASPPPAQPASPPTAAPESFTPLVVKSQQPATAYNRLTAQYETQDPINDAELANFNRYLGTIEEARNNYLSRASAGDKTRINEMFNAIESDLRRAVAENDKVKATQIMRLSAFSRSYSTIYRQQ